MKRKVDWDEEEESDYEDTNASEEESDNEEPGIKDFFKRFFQLVSRQTASDLLHSMATSKGNLLIIIIIINHDIYPGSSTHREVVFREVLHPDRIGQLFRNQRIIPVTNISELVEGMCFIHRS